MKFRNLFNFVIISFIFFFFIGCSTTQVVDNSRENELDALLKRIGDTELKIKTNEKVKKLLIKSLTNLDSDIKLSFVEEIDSQTLVITNNFLNQEFVYFCKSANEYLEETLRKRLFEKENSDDIFIFYKEKYKSQVDSIIRSYPDTKIFEIEDNYNDFIKSIFELKGSYERFDLINRLIQEEEISFIPRSRKDFKKIYIVADYSESKNFIPSLRFNYILDSEIYASSRSIFTIEDRKKLLDFSNVIIAVPNSFLYENKEDSIDLYELTKLSFLQDLLIISAIKKKEGNSQNISGNFANIRYSQNTCSDMNMNIVQIDNLGRFNLL